MPEETLQYPAWVAVEPLMGCNASCFMCPVHSLTRVKGAMKMDVTEKLAEQIDALPRSPNVVLHFLGEPLMDKKLEDRIRLFKQTSAASVSFSTNAQLLNETRARSILESGLDYIELPLESLNKSTYEGIRKNLHFETVKENIERFIRLRDEMEKATRVIPLFITQEETASERERWLDHFGRIIDRSKGDQIRIHHLHNFAGWIDAETSPSASPCPQLRDMFVVLNNGDVPLCCGDPDNTYAMGNILTDGGIVGVYNSEKFRAAREMHNAGLRASMRLCDVCNIPECHSEFV
jgi:sulfatase maturation enzyme AslB (radical SAM superfamily)